MTIRKVKRQDIDTSIIYVTLEELARESGFTANSVRKYFHTEGLDAINYHKKIFVTPDQADKFRALVNCGILAPRRKNQ